MSKRGERFLSVRQLVLAIAGFSIGGGILTLPNTAAKILGPGGWLWVLGVGLVVLFASLLTARLTQMFPEDTVIEFSQRILGRPLGFALGFVLLLFFFLVIPLETRVLQELVNISILPHAPTWFVSGLFLLTLAYGASRDIKSLVYVNELLMEIALVIGLSVTFLSWQHFNPVHLFPIFGNVLIDLENIRYELGVAFIYTGFPIIFFLVPYFKYPKKLGKATVIGVLLLTATYTFFTFTVIGVFGYKEVLNLAFPGLELAKSVNLETIILERLDLVLIVSWISAIFNTCLMAYFVTALGISRLFRIKHHSIITWALAPVTYFLSTLFTNFFVWEEWSSYLGLYAIFVSLVIPAVLMVVALFRRGSIQAGG